MQAENQNITSPSWDEIFQEIGKQLQTRSGLLVKRVLKISLPALAILFLIQLFGRLTQFNTNPSEAFLQLEISSILWGSIALIVIIVFTIVYVAILKIEEAIWLDSYFDEVNLTPEESQRISNKLYGGWCSLQYKIFYRYYLWVILTIVALLYSWIYIIVILGFGRSLSPEFTQILSSILFIGGGIGIILWVRYLKIKLSYVPFVFLDRYDANLASSPEFWNEFFDELNHLNVVSKGDSFKKNVMIELGGDAAMTLVEYIARRIQIGFNVAGAVLPGVTGAVVGTAVYTKTRGVAEVSHRVIMFAKLTGRCVLYRYAYKNIHGVTHHINEYVYSLK